MKKWSKIFMRLAFISIIMQFIAFAMFWSDTTALIFFITTIIFLILSFVMDYK